MAKILGIDFAPLNVPLERRLQTAVVLYYVLIFLVWPYLFIGLTIWLLFSPFFLPTLAYCTWYLYDTNVLRTSSRGGKRWEWLRHSKVWHYYRDYFPLDLIKTHELDSDRNYIMGYHPHGIISCGVFGNFSTEATGFSKKFPGITSYVLTLKANFLVPIFRGFFLYIGGCDVSRESIWHLMTKQGKGNAAVIVVGGAAEALEAKPNVYKILMKNRKGFIRIAIQTGADLVPMYSFGESELYGQVDNPKGSWLRAYQEMVKKMTSISPPFVLGRGIFQYTYGILPFRKPINTVVGAPIRVTQHDNPDQEMVDEYHAKYLEGLSAVFNDHKEKYGIDKDTVLEFM